MVQKPKTDLISPIYFIFSWEFNSEDFEDSKGKNWLYIGPKL